MIAFFGVLFFVTIGFVFFVFKVIPPFFQSWAYINYSNPPTKSNLCFFKYNHKKIECSMKSKIRYDIETDFSCVWCGYNKVDRKDKRIRERKLYYEKKTI